MKGLIKQVIRWPMHSTPRFIATLFVAALAFYGFHTVTYEETDTPAAAASDGGGASDNGGASDGGGDPAPTPDTSDLAAPESVAEGAVTAFVTRTEPSDTGWIEAMQPYAAAAVVGQWQTRDWEPADSAPLTVKSVEVKKDAKEGAVSSTMWESDVIVHATDKGGKEQAFTFHVQARESGGEWAVIRFEETQ